MTSAGKTIATCFALTRQDPLAAKLARERSGSGARAIVQCTVYKLMQESVTGTSWDADQRDVGLSI
jgi:mevalonate pyrophosphate decarboxylase